MHVVLQDSGDGKDEQREYVWNTVYTEQCVSLRRNRRLRVIPDVRCHRKWNLLIHRKRRVVFDGWRKDEPWTEQ